MQTIPLLLYGSLLSDRGEKFKSIPWIMSAIKELKKRLNAITP